MRLTYDFFLPEFTRSATAKKHGIKNVPDDYSVMNLRQLCRHVLQPLRAHLGVPILITSGYRSRQLNKFIGGSNMSAHLTGNAADFQVPGKDLEEIALWMRDALPFDQLILENYPQNNSWIHVSYYCFPETRPDDLNRQAAFRLNNGKYSALTTDRSHTVSLANSRNLTLRRKDWPGKLEDLAILSAEAAANAADTSPVHHGEESPRERKRK